MLENKVIELIDRKASEMNPNALYCCNSVSTIIKQLNGYIEGTINLSEERVSFLLDHLVGYYTITLDLPLDKGLKILRAVKFNNLEGKPCFAEVSRLSYIPKKSNITPSIGRLNKCGESIFYGCVYFDDNFGGYNVAFSEVGALKNEKINILKSETSAEIKVNYVGIYDYIKRESKPYFVSEQVYSYFKSVYEYEEQMFDKYVFAAFQLCDAFFSDILRREESERLYIVTSILASHFLEGDRVDGLIYSSVKAEGYPVIAIKPASVDSKVSHKKAFSFEIQENYGYAIFRANSLYQGVVNGEIINWN
ncbi:hypothetical protein [Shewanella ulleungensis]|uniref:hypothetical protein n=1 Tax=Shewanella ulleungensis TaxID=2282699 RepID=UPI003D79BBDD